MTNDTSNPEEKANINQLFLRDEMENSIITTAQFLLSRKHWCWKFPRTKSAFAKNSPAFTLVFVEHKLCSLLSRLQQLVCSNSKHCLLFADCLRQICFWLSKPRNRKFPGQIFSSHTHHSGVDDGITVEVLEQNRLRERRHVVRARTSETAR